jgi:hypothetical protein
LDLSVGSWFTPGSIASSTQRIVCDERMRTPLVGKQELAKMEFTSLASTVAGDGNIFFAFAQNDSSADQREVTVVTKFDNTHELRLPSNPLPGIPPYRTEVSGVRVGCADSMMSSMKSEYYDSSNNLIYMYTYATDFKDIQPASPLALLRRIVCNANEAGK